MIDREVYCSTDLTKLNDIGLCESLTYEVDEEFAIAHAISTVHGPVFTIWSRLGIGKLVRKCLDGVSDINHGVTESVNGREGASSQIRSVYHQL